MGPLQKSQQLAAYVRQALVRHGYRSDDLGDLTNEVLWELSRTWDGDPRKIEASLAARKGFRGSREQKAIATALAVVIGSCKDRRCREIVPELEESDHDDPAVLVARNDPDLITKLEELKAALVSEMGRLTERERNVLRLIVVEERTYRQAAEVLDISLSTVSAAVRKALARLTERLEVYRQYYA